jgi:hypothetical protein
VSDLGGTGPSVEVKGTKEPSLFDLHNQINFLIFCRTKVNEFLNSVFIKILKIKSSFLRIFILRFIKNWKFLKLNQSVFSKPTKLDRNGFPSFHKTDQFSSVFENLLPSLRISLKKLGRFFLRKNLSREGAGGVNR